MRNCVMLIVHFVWEKPVLKPQKEKKENLKKEATKKS